MDWLCKSIGWFLHDSDVFIDPISFSGVCMLESGFKFSLAIKYFYLLPITQVLQHATFCKYFKTFVLVYWEKRKKKENSIMYLMFL